MELLPWGYLTIKRETNSLKEDNCFELGWVLSSLAGNEYACVELKVVIKTENSSIILVLDLVYVRTKDQTAGTKRNLNFVDHRRSYVSLCAKKFIDRD